MFIAYVYNYYSKVVLTPGKIYAKACGKSTKTVRKITANHKLYLRYTFYMSIETAPTETTNDNDEILELWETTEPALTSHTIHESHIAINGVTHLQDELQQAA